MMQGKDLQPVDCSEVAMIQPVPMSMIAFQVRRYLNSWQHLRLDESVPLARSTAISFAGRPLTIGVHETGFRNLNSRKGFGKVL